MPVYLSQISRREFLKRSFAAGAGLALVPAVLAEGADKPSDRNTFAFFSDTHVAADSTLESSGVNMAYNLAQSVGELMAWPVRPATIFVNGDLAFKKGGKDDYATFGKLIAPMRTLAPVYLSLGNHDDRKNFWSAFPEDAATEKKELKRQATVFSSDRANWFQIDSLDRTNTAPGDFGAKQIEWLDRELAARPDKPAIIVGHHHLQPPPVTTGLKDSAALEEIFAQHRQVKAYIYGHTHNWHVTEHPTGVHLVNLPPTAYVFAKGRPSGWVRATLGVDGAEFELRALDRTHPEHGQVKKLVWRA